ncbi:MAG TPA: hypothetical protein VFR15_13895, partial [Chloroflexia bacterium]|nr:hypothetical protein [Chloroflexia bacterium]
PDGTLEIIQTNSSLPTGWYVDRHGRLVALKDGGVAVTDLTTGHSSQVNFPGVSITNDEWTTSTASMLVPLSTDGRWAAYRNDNSARIGPDGRPAYGRTVHIVRVK